MNTKCEVKFCNDKKAWRLYRDGKESIDGKCYQTKDEAVNAARNFSINIPDGKTSGWYLPSSGQMWQIANRFFHNDEFVVQKSLLNLADKYIVSQPKEIICPLCLDLKEREFSYGNTDERFLVRPVFSF